MSKLQKVDCIRGAMPTERTGLRPKATLGASKESRLLQQMCQTGKLVRLSFFLAFCMKSVRFFIALGLCMLAFSAAAQWIWMEKDGRKVYSDRAPGPEIPAKSILKQPGKRAAAPEPVSADDAASSAADAGTKATARPGTANPLKPSGKDKELEDKKKQAEAAEASKTKAEQEKATQAKAENCERAKRNLTTLKSGIRLQRTDAKGEREFIGDQERAAETARVEGVVAGC